MTFALLFLACHASPWPEAERLQVAAREQGPPEGMGPMWVDVARQASRVRPWHSGYAEARALLDAIEAGRLEGLRRRYAEAPPGHPHRPER